MGGVSLWCGIEQIHVGGSKGRPCLSQSRQYLIGERFVFPTKRRIFVGGMNISPIRYCSRFLFSLWYKCFFFSFEIIFMIKCNVYNIETWILRLSFENNFFFFFFEKLKINDIRLLVLTFLIFCAISSQKRFLCY